jgi:FkbM family methyltransferase
MFPPALRAILSRLNRAPFWRWASLPVWEQRLVLPSADRLLYASLHLAGLMGRADRRFFENEIKPGMIVVDVGANIGLYALLFSHLVGARGKVLAFEPDPALFAALDRARQLNRRENLRVFPVALGAKAEKKMLEKSFFNSGDNRLSAATPGRAPHGEPTEISVARGDDLLADEPLVDFIKIDVQGWELHALKGLRETIDRSPGIQIYLEFWPRGLRDSGASPEALFDFLNFHGLTILRNQGSEWQRVESINALMAGVRDNQYINLWAKKRP